jgi:hypothetical protein
MPKYLGVSAIALGAMLAATAPSVAASLNIGGSGPLVDLDSNSGGDATVNVDTDDGVGVDLNLDSTTDGVVGEGGDDAILDLFGDGTTGGLLDGNLADVNGEGDAIVDADLLNGGEDSVIIDLFGEAGGDATAKVAIGEGIGDLELLDDAVLEDLFGLAGDGSIGEFEDLGEVAAIDSADGVTTVDVLDDTAMVTLGNGLDTGADLFGEDAATIDFGNERAAIALFDGGAGAEVDLGGLDAPDVSGVGSPAFGGLDVPETDGVDVPELGRILPDGAGGIGLAPIGVGEDDGGDDATAVVADSKAEFDGDSSDFTGVGAGRIGAAANLAARTSTRCFSPDEGQISHLISRQSYDPATVADWDETSDIRVIAVQLCPAAKVRVSQVAYADANMSFLRAAVSADADVKAKLNMAGRDAGDVLAVDKKGDSLVVYVY